MDRRSFLRSSCGGCAGIALGVTTLSLTGCSTMPMVKVVNDGGIIRLPLTAFTGSDQVIARTAGLPNDVFVMKLPNDGGYRSLYLRCTHRDQPLTATSTGLHCPSHGSRFALDGSVQQGPATEGLHPFQTVVDGEFLIIHLNPSVTR